MEELRQLVVHAQSGDVAAFERLVRRFQDMAVGCAYARLRDFGLAEDAAQEAFIETYRKLADLRKPEAFPGWFRTTVLKFCDRITRRKRVPVVSLEDGMAVASSGPRPDETLARAEIHEAVLEAVRALPGPQRMATSLFYINGYSQDEIAQFLEVPLTTVQKRLHDSRLKMKARMMDMVDQALKAHAPKVDFA